MKELVGTFNQEKVLVGAFSVIVKTDGSFAALLQIQGGQNLGRGGTKPGYIMESKCCTKTILSAVTDNCKTQKFDEI